MRLSHPIPTAPLMLGLAGLIPFYWAVLLIWGLPPALTRPLPGVLSGDGATLMLRYGGIILSFMSGALWGFATRAHGRAALCYGLSVLPALWWLFAPDLGTGRALFDLALGFAGLLAIDALFAHWRLAPGWWMRLRLILTAGVLAAIGLAYWSLG